MCFSRLVSVVASSNSQFVPDDIMRDIELMCRYRLISVSEIRSWIVSGYQMSISDNLYFKAPIMFTSAVC